MKRSENENKKYSISKMLLEFLHGSGKYYFLTVITILISSAADMINPQIISFTVDSIIDSKIPELPSFALKIVEAAGGVAYLSKNLWLIALAIVLVAVVSASMRYLFTVSYTKAAETTVQTIRNRLFSHIEHLPFSWHMKNQTGDIIQRCTSDVDMVKRFLSEQLVSVFRIIVLILLALYFMFSMNVRLAVIALITMPVIVGYSALFHRIIGRKFEDCDENEGRLSAIVQENLTGVRVVRAFGKESYEKEKFGKQNDFYCGLWEKLGNVMSAFWCSSDFVSGLQVMLIIVFGAVMCAHGEMTAGRYIAFISYNSMLVWPIRQLGRMISELSKATVSMKRIAYILSSEPEHDKPNALTPDLNGDIVFEHVNFAYDNCPQVLTDINLEIKAGSTLGILGATGSGKSTLMYLLDRLYDLPAENGRITIGGIDIADMKAKWVRSQIGMVLQEPFLFSKTLEENIGIASDKITLSEIREAAKIACLDDAVSQFANGYDTFVGERGVTLSGGQKQRAAIARMLTGKKPIMIFDDSLSAVDTETDAKIRAALAGNTGDATVILIAHRITTLMHADKIIVLDKGRIAEEGTHDELCAKGGLYAKIYAIQTNMN